MEERQEPSNAVRGEVVDAGTSALIPALGGAAAWMLVALVAHSRVRFVVLAIGFLAGRGAAPHATRTRDTRTVWAAVVATLIAIAIGEYLVTNVIARELATELATAVKTPVSPAQLWPLLTATGDVGLMFLTWAGACVAAMLPVRGALRADREPAAGAVSSMVDDAPESEDAPRVRRVRAPTRAGVAKISCARCGDLVELSTTERRADGNYCIDCVAEG